MRLEEFFLRLSAETTLNSHIIANVMISCVKPDETIEEELFNKITLMFHSGIPAEVMMVVLKNSIDMFNDLDVCKFYDELGAYKSKLKMTSEQIKQDIAQYKSKLKERSMQTMPLIDAVRELQKVNFSEDFIFDKILPYITDSKTADYDVEHIMVGKVATDVIVWMKLHGWSQQDITDALNQQIDGTPGFDIKKLEKYIPESLQVNRRKISKHNGEVKYITHKEFFKYINPVLRFFSAHASEIVEISTKYQENKLEFAKEFFDLYTKYRGWDQYGPRLVIQEEQSSAIGGFLPTGKVVLKRLEDQESIVNTIIHELVHFEQYLMLINTQDVGLKPYAKEHALQGIARLVDVYSKDEEARTVLTEEDYDDFEKKLGKFIFVSAQKCFEGNFYDNALKIPYKKITPTSPEYAMVKKIAAAHTMAYDHKNYGNKVLLYPTLFTEQMAYSIGNAGAGMFRNVIMDKSQSKNLNNIMSFATRHV